MNGGHMNQTSKGIEGGADTIRKPPQRRIVRKIEDALPRRTRAGFQFTVELECGHLETVNARGLRSGKTWCDACRFPGAVEQPMDGYAISNGVNLREGTP